MKSKKTKLRSKTLKKIFGSKNIIPVGVIVAFAVVGLYMFISTSAAPKRPNICCSEPSLYFNVSPSSARVGDVINVEVWEDSLNVQINGVQANFSYPKSNLELVDFGSASDFNLLAQQTDDNGIIKIARATTGSYTGKHLVGSLRFKAVSRTSQAQLSFQSDSAIAGPGTNYENGLGKSVNTSIRIR